MTIFERFFRGRAPAQSPPPEPHPNSRIRTIERALTQLIPIAEEELRNDPSLRVLVARHTLTLSEAARRIKAHENNDDFTEGFLQFRSNHISDFDR